MKTLYHCTFDLSYHFVFVTKYRRKVLTDEMLSFMRETIARLCELWDAQLVEFNGEKALRSTSRARVPQAGALEPNLLCGKLRRRAAGRHQAVHPEPSAPGVSPAKRQFTTA
jgi:hypothetical protein